MCLYTYQKKPSIAGKDMFCYKIMTLDVLTIRDEGDIRKQYRLNSYVRGYPYKLGNVRTEALFDTDVNRYEYCTNKFFDLRWVYAHKYGFHAYTTLNEANRMCKRLQSYEAKNILVVAKCRIPEGTPYFNGDIDSEGQLCSQAIEVVGWKCVNAKKWRTTMKIRLKDNILCA